MNPNTVGEVKRLTSLIDLFMLSPTPENKRMISGYLDAYPIEERGLCNACATDFWEYPKTDDLEAVDYAFLQPLIDFLRNLVY